MTAGAVVGSGFEVELVFVVLEFERLLDSEPESLESSAEEREEEDASEGGRGGLWTWGAARLEVEADADADMLVDAAVAVDLLLLTTGTDDTDFLGERTTAAATRRGARDARAGRARSSRLELEAAAEEDEAWMGDEAACLVCGFVCARGCVGETGAGVAVV